MNSSKRVKAALDALRGLSKCSIILITTLFLLLLIPTITLVSIFAFGSSCDALDDCDEFKPICGSSKHGDHQFFYSQCDMERENCMTGENWKIDYFTHCNVFMN